MPAKVTPVKKKADPTVEVKTEEEPFNHSNPQHPRYVNEDAGIKLANHGGGCCGIRHIWNFWLKPGQFVKAREAFNVKYPIQTSEERLVEVCKTREKHVLHGIIEVVLVASERENWHEALLRNGFRQVNANKNSNSNNNIYIYHRSSGNMSGTGPDVKTAG
jgi:hypothetical protein